MLRMLREFGGGISSRWFGSCPSDRLPSSCCSRDRDQFSLKAYAPDEEEVLADDEDIADQDAPWADDEGIGPHANLTGQADIPRTIIVHNSPPKAAWDWLILLLVIYVAVMTPYLAAFRMCTDDDDDHDPVKASPVVTDPRENNGSDPSEPPASFMVHFLSDRLVLVDLLVDITFLVDMFVNFRTTYLKNGELVVNPRKIATNYLRGWFLIDAVSAIPFDLILSVVRTSDTMTATGLLKTPRLLRLLRVARRIDQYSEYGATVLLLLMASFTMIAHWMACIFYAIAQCERKDLDPSMGFLNHLNESGSTFEHYDLTSGPDLRSRYISSLYFTFTILTSVGFGNIAPESNNEKVFSIFAMMLGSLMSAAVFGNVSSIMLRLYQGTEDYHEKTTSIKEFIKFHCIPSDLGRRLLDSNQQTWWETGGVDMEAVHRSFPEGLQADICLHLNKALLIKCPAFQHATPGFLRALSTKLAIVHIPPGEVVIGQGDLLPAIYFIGKGSVEISRDSVVYAILGANDVFGEDIQYAILEPGIGFYRSGFLVRALNYCDIHKITVNELLEIVSLFSEFASIFQQKFQVTFNLRISSDVSRDPSKTRVSLDSTIKPPITEENDLQKQRPDDDEEDDEEDEEVEVEGEEEEEMRSVVKVNLANGVSSMEQREEEEEEEEGDTTSCDISGAERATTSGLMWDNFDVGDGSSISTGILTEDAESVRRRLRFGGSDENPESSTMTTERTPLAEETSYANINAKINDLSKRMFDFDQQLTAAVGAILEILTSDPAPE